MSHPIQLFSLGSCGPTRLPLDPKVRQVHEVMDQIATGVYTGFRTFEGTRFLGLAEHLDRLQGCMQQMGFALPLEREALRRAIDQVVRTHVPSGEDSFLRIDVLPTPHSYPGSKSRVLITRGELQRVDPDFQARGVKIDIAEDLKRETPSIKTSDFVLTRRSYPVGTRDCYEHLMLDAEGYLLEATSSNFYGFLQGELRSAPEGILAGITRRFLFFLCAGLEFSVNTSAIHRDQLAELEEAFLTSSTRGIVPVVEVAGVRIGSGQPGPRTLALMQSYFTLCQRAPQPAWPLTH